MRPAGLLFGWVAERDKPAVVFPVARLVELGFEIMATAGTADVLRRYGITTTLVRKASDGPGPDGEPTVLDMILAGEVDMVVNTPNGQGARADGYDIRTATTAVDKPIVTTIQQFAMAVLAIEAIRRGPFSVRSLQEFNLERAAKLAASA